MSNKRCDQTIRERLGSGGARGPVYAAAIAVCVGAVCTGTVLAWTSNSAEKLMEGQLNGLIIVEQDFFWTACIMTIGCCTATLPVAMMLETLGRKTTMMVCTLPLYIGYVFILFAQHKYMLFGGRFITGLGAGAFSCCCPLYAAEIAHKETRGRVVSFYFMFYSFGFVYANILGWFLPIKLYIFACIIVPVMFTAMFFFQPKSPVHSIQCGKAHAATEALTALRGSKHDVAAEIRNIKLELSKHAETSHFYEVFKDRGVIRGIIISIGLVMMKHLVGTINVLTFTANIVAHLHFSDTTVKSCVVATGLIQVLASFVPILYVDRVGRRFLLFVGFSITLASSGVLGIYHVLLDREVVAQKTLLDFNMVPLIALALYWFGYGAGLGNTAAMMSVEVFPASIRAKCKCFTEFFNWAGSFLVTWAYIQLGEAYGHDLMFFFYTFFSIIGILLTIFVYPETMMKDSLEIFEELASRKHIYRSYRAEPLFTR